MRHFNKHFGSTHLVSELKHQSTLTSSCDAPWRGASPIGQSVLQWPTSMSATQLPITLFHAKTTSFVPENGTNLQRQCRLSVELSFASMQASEVTGALPPLNGYKRLIQLQASEIQEYISSHPCNHMTNTGQPARRPRLTACASR